MAAMCRRKRQETFGQSPKELRWLGKEGVGGRDGEGADVTEGTEVVDVITIAPVEIDNRKPFVVSISIQGVALTMEIDTGAAVTLISEKTRRTKFSGLPLLPCMIKLRTYTSERIKVCGELKVQVQYGKLTKECSLIVMEGDGPSLMGRDWLLKFRLDWQSIGQVQMQSFQDRLGPMLEKYAEVFSEKPSKIQPFEAKLVLKGEGRPVFCRPRSVPFALKGAIEEELAKLVKLGVLVQVPSSEWATPIVPVVRSNNKVRLCGDYKVTINPVLDIEQYPLPKPEEMFATLAEGEKFTKIDLTNAYLQLPLDEESRKLCTINTHRVCSNLLDCLLG